MWCCWIRSENYARCIHSRTWPLWVAASRHTADTASSNLGARCLHGHRSAHANFAAVTQALLDEDAVIQLRETDEPTAELARVFTELLSDEPRRCSIAERAKAVCDRNRGATERTIDLISHLLAATPAESGEALPFSPFTPLQNEPGRPHCACSLSLAYGAAVNIRFALYRNGIFKTHTSAFR